jgi:hypothetical protein
MIYPPILSIYRQLLKLRKKRRYNPVGICSNLVTNSDKSRERINKAISDWPASHDSGSCNYPVENTSSKYHHDSDEGQLWNNPRRYELLEYLIDHFKPKGRSTILLKLNNA